MPSGTKFTLPHTPTTPTLPGHSPCHAMPAMPTYPTTPAPTHIPTFLPVLLPPPPTTPPHHLGGGGVAPNILILPAHLPSYPLMPWFYPLDPTLVPTHHLPCRQTLGQEESGCGGGGVLCGGGPAGIYGDVFRSFLLWRARTLLHRLPTPNAWRSSPAHACYPSYLPITLLVLTTMNRNEHCDTYRCCTLDHAITTYGGWGVVVGVVGVGWGPVRSDGRDGRWLGGGLVVLYLFWHLLPTTIQHFIVFGWVEEV